VRPGICKAWSCMMFFKKVFKAGSAPGPGSCPFCGGALALSKKTALRACLTCGFCRACGLIVTPDGGGQGCGRCDFLLYAARPLGDGVGGGR